MWPKLDIFVWYNRLSAREQRVLQVGVACVFLWLLDTAIFRPVWGLYVSTKEEIALAEMTLARNKTNLERKESVESAYTKYRSFVKPAGNDEEENANLLSEIERLARSNQVVLVDMKPREIKVSQFHKEYTAELDAESDMKNLIGFIYQLEQSGQLMKVFHSKFSPKDAKSDVIKAKIVVTKIAFLGDS